MALLNPLQLANLNAEVAKVCEGFKIPAPMRLSDWADQNFYLSAESSAISGPWRTLPYQRAIMDAGMANDDVQAVTFAKSARVGYTKMNVAAFGYFLAHKKRSVVMYLPMDDDAKGVVRDDIDPALRDCPALRAALKSDPDKKRSSENTQSKKQFFGATADILGGKAARNYRRLTKDVVFFDELDAFDEDIEGEGSPVALGDKRLEVSTYPKSIRGSTMGVSGQSLIERELEDADWIFRREVPCPGCDDFAPLKWSQFRYDDKDASTVRRVCDACGYEARYNEYQAMDARGVWRTEDGIEIDEDSVSFRNADGEPVLAKPHIAFRIWTAYSYFTTWTAIVAEWLRADRDRKTGDQTRFKAFINLWLGEVYEQPGTKLDYNWLMERRETYAAPAPDGVEAIVMGVDIQEDRIEIEYLGVGQGEETWSLDYVKLYGDTSEAPVYDALDKALDRRFAMEGAGEMGVCAAGIDSGYQSDLVYAFCKPRRNRGVIAFKGYAGFDRPWIGNKEKKPIAGQRADRANVMPVGVDHFKEHIFNRLQVTAVGPGYCHFPTSYARDYFEGLTAEKLQPKKLRGFVVNQWVKIRTRNEPLDLRVYALAALRLERNELTNVAAVARGVAAPVSESVAVAPTQADYDAGHEHDGGFLDDTGDFIGGFEGDW